LKKYKGDGSWATNFKDMAFERVEHFSSLLKENTFVAIAEVIKLSNTFLSFVNEDNQALTKEVVKEELYQTPQSFQKEKVLDLMDYLWKSSWTIVNL